MFQSDPSEFPAAYQHLTCTSTAAGATHGTVRLVVLQLSCITLQVLSTYEACTALLSEGVDLSAASSSAASNSLAQME